jgi:hypothetical protein
VATFRIPRNLTLHVRARAEPWDIMQHAGMPDMMAYLGAAMDLEPTALALPRMPDYYAMTAHAEALQAREYFKRTIHSRLSELTLHVAELIASEMTGLAPRVPPECIAQEEPELP